ncbi:transglutaminase domain-containing protein [Segetibacter sp.]|jgi:hypothetical protein|uniref:transglutaminase domain-containing protein n=1 Tax=Segetibacter sp. TaxID=2231182 RepID=UPI0026208210|nr:transglutaminase domain-containing protein [Segetibacter sp.]MCW3078817.1 hypothetical protein [Segetibacter sp.]
MKQIKLIIGFSLLSQILFAQKVAPKAVNEYAAIDNKVLQIPDSLTKTTEGIATYITSNFGKDAERARAIFIWVATHIEYDIENMFAINFYEQKAEKIARSLRTRKGICENYAALFNDICAKAGIKSFVIEGYTKQNGFADYIPHAWCAALVDNSWLMFDPTWGSGYVNNGKFFKKINNSYFKALPSSLIKSHMPFDYLWQFLNYPVTNQEFYEGKTEQNKTKPVFDFVASIQTYEKQNHIEQLIASSFRVQQNGIKNSLIFDRLQHLKLEIENYKQTQSTGLYNAAVQHYNEGINHFNVFIQYRNTRFSSKKTDAEIESMIDTTWLTLSKAKTNLSKIKEPDANTTLLIAQLNKSIDDVIIHVKEQQEWLKLYFSKGKLARKSMFYKYTWFGIPVN